MGFDARHPEAVLDIATAGANGLHLMAVTGRALREAGVPPAELDEFFRQAGSGDYDNLLRVMMSWVTVTDSGDLLDED